MKIAHSLIVLTAIIFVSGSMLSVGMDLKATTDNIATNVVEAKHKYNEEKEDSLNKELKAKSENDEMVQVKTMYKVKLESLNQTNISRSKKIFLPGRRIENRMSID